MTPIPCLECRQPFTPMDSPFAPRVCEPCLEAKRQAIAAESEKGRDSLAKANQINLMTMIARKVTTPTVLSQLPYPEAHKRAQCWLYTAHGGPVLVIYGPSGHGKTRTTAAIALEWAREKLGRTLDWWNGLELKAAVQEATRPGVQSQTLAGLRGQLCRPGWLVIDDMLHTRATPAFGEFLLSVLDERIARGRKTILTIQTPQGEGAEDQTAYVAAVVARQFDNALTGEAVARRLHEHATLIHAA